MANDKYNQNRPQQQGQPSRPSGPPPTAPAPGPPPDNRPTQAQGEARPKPPAAPTTQQGPPPAIPTGSPASSPLPPGPPTSGPGIGPAPTTVNKLGQQVAEAEPRPTTPPYVGAGNTGAGEYLAKNGWECLGMDEFGRTLWKDPWTSHYQKPERTMEVVLPVQGGGSEVIRQWVAPAIPWDYDTQSALVIQHARERAGRGLEALVEHKRAELARLEAELASRQEQAEAPAA